MVTNDKTPDLLVVGGGPAGLAAAIVARRLGLGVTVIDKRQPPIDKACGEGIMPDGVETLARLGVILPRDRVAAFGGIRYIEGGIMTTARFRAGSGLGVRRTVLHEALIGRARSLGVHLDWGRAVRRLSPDGVEADGSPVRGRWIVCADGHDSLCRRALGLDVSPIHERFGIRRHFRVRPWADLVEVHWSDSCEIYVTPVAPDQVCVATLTRDTGLRLDEALRRFPALEKRLRHAAIISDDQGASTVFRRLPRVVSGRYALIGDASGSVDALTGEGVSLALRQALALGAALREGDLRAYGAAHARLMRLPAAMSRGMLAISGKG
ncbi:MAG: NAD(P)/FAD-dependent oxidoreductase [Acidobacteriota bacterium]